MLIITEAALDTDWGLIIFGAVILIGMIIAFFENKPKI